MSSKRTSFKQMDQRWPAKVFHWIREVEVTAVEEERKKRSWCRSNTVEKSSWQSRPTIKQFTTIFMWRRNETLSHCIHISGAARRRKIIGGARSSVCRYPLRGGARRRVYTNYSSTYGLRSSIRSEQRSEPHSVYFKVSKMTKLFFSTFCFYDLFTYLNQA